MFDHSKPDLDELAHYGVKGMRWGVHHRREVHRRIMEKSVEKHGAPTATFKSGGETFKSYRGNYKELKREVLSDMQRERQKAKSSAPSRKTNRMARKDAKEYARAKMFYGEGAGTRRKLIKARVDDISKRDPSYKQAFEKHLAEQNMAVHASKARRERRNKDVKNSTAKTARGISHYLRGNKQYASAAAAMIAGGALWAHKSGVDKVVLKAGKTSLKNAQGYLKGKNIKPGMTASEFLKNL